jgi:hypothetical protein
LGISYLIGVIYSQINLLKIEQIKLEQEKLLIEKNTEQNKILSEIRSICSSDAEISAHTKYANNRTMYNMPVQEGYYNPNQYEADYKKCLNEYGIDD